MIDKILKGIIGVVGALGGYSLVNLLRDLGLIKVAEKGVAAAIIYVGASIVSGIIFIYLSSWIIKKGRKIARGIEKELEKFSMFDIVLATIGLIVGLVLAFLITSVLRFIEIPYVGAIISVFVYILLGYLGIAILLRRKEDIKSGFTNMKKAPKEKAEIKGGLYPKILDTSVIIDGRIADICKTGFIEGPLVIPQFVLGELQHIADSSDGLKRNRGRRGLDILNIIQKELDIEVIISEEKFDDTKEVDGKLLKLTEKLNGKILTNDYNLNKVAEVRGISVLNINDLANAVKPIVIPGEEMVVDVVKDGKESNQGLAYLDDGTMIVVEQGRKYIGKTIEVVVTSVLQTSAGRMIFAKPKELM